MKKLQIVSFVVALTAIFTSCDKDEVIDPTTLPSTAQEYVSFHFPEANISRVVEDKGDNDSYYEVYLSTGHELDFNKKGEIHSVDGKTLKLPFSVIPPKLLTYATEKYPDAFIVKWEKERTLQEIKLNTGIELVFDLEGNFKNVDN